MSPPRKTRGGVLRGSRIWRFVGEVEFCNLVFIATDVLWRVAIEYMVNIQLY